MRVHVTVFTKPSCVQCDMTKKVLDRDEIAYITRDVTADVEAFDLVKGLGYQAAPVVLVEGKTVSDRKGEQISHWSGLRPDLLAQL